MLLCLEFQEDLYDRGSIQANDSENGYKQVLNMLKSLN